MNKIKEFLKNKSKEIMLIIITMTITSVISVFATISFSADEITFQPNTNWNVSDANAALNDLYSYANSGDATASNILVGKTALVNGSLITGTMVDNGAVTSSLNAGDSYTIPAGYHNGSGKVTATSAGYTKLVYLGTTGTSYNLTGYSGYQNFTVANNIIIATPAAGSAGQGSISWSIYSYNGSFTPPSASYNASTGVLTTSNGNVSASVTGTNGSRSTALSAKVYLYY